MGNEESREIGPILGLGPETVLTFGYTPSPRFEDPREGAVTSRTAGAGSTQEMS